MIVNPERTAWTRYGWLPEVDPSCYGPDSAPLDTPRASVAERCKIRLLQAWSIFRQLRGLLMDILPESDHDRLVREIRGRGPTVTADGVFHASGLPPEARAAYEAMAPPEQEAFRARIGSRVAGITRPPRGRPSPPRPRSGILPTIDVTTDDMPPCKPPRT
jgi:hypothetical protein